MSQLQRARKWVEIRLVRSLENSLRVATIKTHVIHPPLRYSLEATCAATTNSAVQWRDKTRRDEKRLHETIINGKTKRGAEWRDAARPSAQYVSYSAQKNKTPTREACARASVALLRVISYLPTCGRENDLVEWSLEYLSRRRAVRNVRWEVTWILSLRRSPDNERCPPRKRVSSTLSRSQLMGEGGATHARAGGGSGFQRPRGPWLPRLRLKCECRARPSDDWVIDDCKTCLVAAVAAFSYLAPRKAAFYTSAYKGCFWTRWTIRRAARPVAVNASAPFAFSGSHNLYSALSSSRFSLPLRVHAFHARAITMTKLLHVLLAALVCVSGTCGNKLNCKSYNRHA